jgi:membrane associated rhomboid family serine protease
MPYYEYEFRRPGHFSFGPPLSPGIKKLMIIMGVIFFLQLIIGNFLLTYFSLRPYFFWRSFFLWQPVTYIFLHGGLMHILFNLFALWMFGSDLEYRWGTPFFIKYFFITGIGAGLSTAMFTPNSPIPTIGASGAIYGILLAFAVTYPDRIIYLNFLFPIKAKYFALIFGLIEFYSTVSQRGDGIAHMAHLGGMVIGYIYLDYPNILKRIKKLRNRRQDDFRKWQ